MNHFVMAVVLNNMKSLVLQDIMTEFFISQAVHFHRCNDEGNTIISMSLNVIYKLNRFLMVVKYIH